VARYLTPPFCAVRRTTRFITALGGSCRGKPRAGIAGAANGYLKADDARVIAASALIGGGESSTFSIPVSALKADEAYSFFCTFPGHASIMKGELVLGD
jgi:azurin